jgi:hypothetical protein
MKKHFSATKYLPIALALAAFTASGTASAFAQQSGWGAGISTRNGTPFVHPFDRASLPPPLFNQSNPYTVPQSPEKPVSPASPGSVFGDH